MESRNSGAPMQKENESRARTTLGSSGYLSVQDKGPPKALSAH